jgi:glyoxylase-like metal-dependent hydrolase (beta-lactamase superfamily II)
MQAYEVRGRARESRSREVASDVERVATGFVNSYLVGGKGHWVLVDTGITGLAPLVKQAAEARFGFGAKPAAIVLTHGHFDHAGNVNALVGNNPAIPVYAHTLELPYLSGRSDYPPQDPTVGGAIAQMSRAFPHSGRVIGATLKPLEGNEIPEMPGWRWIHTPGHTAGHISLFRAADGLLIAGDALSTMNMDSWIEQVRRTPQVCGPPAPLTTDWTAARRSVESLASLRPRVVAAGHGLPLTGDGLPEALQQFARSFTPPAHGRYVNSPAVAGPDGVEWVPPPPPDPFPMQAAGAAMVAVGAIGLAASLRGRRR